MAMCFLKTGLSQEAEETGQTKSVFRVALSDGLVGDLEAAGEPAH